MQKSEYKNIFNFESKHWWYKGLHELVENYIKNLNNPNLKILDAGCGTGKVITVLNKYGDVTGFDYSEEAIKYCRNRELDNVKVVDLNYWVPKNECYDIIVCLDVLYHSSISDDIGIIRKFFDSLKTNGLIIMNLPAFNCLKRSHDIVVGGKRRYTKNELINNLTNIGFEPIISTYRLFFLFPIIIIKKIIERFKHTTEVTTDLHFPGRLINRFLFKITQFENILILRGINISVGSSLFIIAQKK